MLLFEHLVTERKAGLLRTVHSTRDQNRIKPIKPVIL